MQLTRAPMTSHVREAISTIIGSFAIWRGVIS